MILRVLEIPPVLLEIGVGISNEIEVAPIVIDKTTILEIRPMIALPF